MSTTPSVPAVDINGLLHKRAALRHDYRKLLAEVDQAATRLRAVPGVVATAGDTVRDRSDRALAAQIVREADAAAQLIVEGRQHIEDLERRILPDQQELERIRALEMARRNWPWWKVLGMALGMMVGGGCLLQLVVSILLAVVGALTGHSVGGK